MRYASNATAALLRAGLTAIDMTLDTEAAVRQAVTQLGAALQAIVDSVGQEEFAAEYRRSLNWQPSPPPAASPPPPVVAAASRRRRIAIIIAVPCAAALLLAGGLAAAVLVVRRRRAAARAADVELQQAPGVGPNTTLVVTDIQDSTTLWEALDVAVMDAALKVHHRVLREVLQTHRGYESATEGDSFILAFHAARHAVGFCLAAQQALLEAPWPRELLDHAPLPQAAADPWDNPSGVVVMTHLPPTKPTYKSLRPAVHSQQGQPTPASSAASSPKRTPTLYRAVSAVAMTIAAVDSPLFFSRSRTQTLPLTPKRRPASSSQVQGLSTRHAAQAAVLTTAEADSSRIRSTAGTEAGGNSTDTGTSTDLDSWGAHPLPTSLVEPATTFPPAAVSERPYGTAAFSATRRRTCGATAAGTSSTRFTLLRMQTEVAVLDSRQQAEEGLLQPTKSAPAATRQQSAPTIEHYLCATGNEQHAGQSPGSGGASAPIPPRPVAPALLQATGSGSPSPTAGDSGRLESPMVSAVLIRRPQHVPPVRVFSRLGQLPVVSEFDKVQQGHSTYTLNSCHSPFQFRQTTTPRSTCGGYEVSAALPTQPSLQYEPSLTGSIDLEGKEAGGTDAAAVASQLLHTSDFALLPSVAAACTTPKLATCGFRASFGPTSPTASGALDFLRQQTGASELLSPGPPARIAPAGAPAAVATAITGTAPPVPVSVSTYQAAANMGFRPRSAAAARTLAAAFGRKEVLREAPSPLLHAQVQAATCTSLIAWLRQQWVVLPLAVTPTEDHEAAGPVLSPVAGGEGSAAAASAAGGLAAACRMGGSDSPVSGLSGRNVVPDASRSGGRWGRVGGGGAASARVLVYRGLRVRMGCACRLLRRTDVSQNQASGRMQYSGPALRLAKAVADAANGGMVLLSDCTYDSLCNEGAVASKALPHAKLLWLGRYMVGEDLPPLQLIQALTRGSFMMGRLALQRPLRNVTPVPPLGGSGLSGVLSAPMVGHGAVARISVIGYGALLAWNVEVAHRALNVLYDALLDGLVAAAGATAGEKMPYVVEGAFGLYNSGGIGGSCSSGDDGNSNVPQAGTVSTWTNEKACRKTKFAGINSTSSGSATLPFNSTTSDAAAVGYAAYGDGSGGGGAAGAVFRRNKHPPWCDDGNTVWSMSTFPQLLPSQLQQLPLRRSGSARVLG
ncbi:hypothetical protein Agub_g8726, partial [Astrephomene gubernaculifera]